MKDKAKEKAKRDEARRRDALKGSKEYSYSATCDKCGQRFYYRMRQEQKGLDENGELITTKRGSKPPTKCPLCGATLGKTVVPNFIEALTNAITFAFAETDKKHHQKYGGDR